MWESRNGEGAPASDATDPADIVLQQLADSEESWADGAALYGPGGTWDALRKSYLSTRSLEIRDSKSGATPKPTEAWIDQAAHADAEYTGFLDEHTVARAKWLALDAERQRLWGMLRLMQAGAYDARRAGV